MNIFISTGGKGNRLGDLTKDLPKPLVPILGKPVLHHLVDWAKLNGFKDIILLNGYKSEKIVDYFGDGKKFGVNIVHSNEPEPLDSGGALKFAERYIDGPFVYISGDHLCEVNLKKMIEFHNYHNSDITILVHKSSHPEDSDILQIDENGKVVKFVSKHEDHTGAGDISNSGLCIIEPSIVPLMDKRIFNFENYIYSKMLDKNMALVAYQSDEFIADMGTPTRLKKCEDHLLSKKQKDFITIDLETK